MRQRFVLTRPEPDPSQPSRDGDGAGEGAGLRLIVPSQTQHRELIGAA
jgi:hypothetical protein